MMLTEPVITEYGWYLHLRRVAKGGGLAHRYTKLGLSRWARRVCGRQCMLVSLIPAPLEWPQCQRCQPGWYREANKILNQLGVGQ